MIPDELVCYEAHNIAYVRYGDKWYQAITGPDVRDVLAAPGAVSLEEVYHPFFKAAGPRTVYKRHGRKLVRITPPGRTRKSKTRRFSVRVHIEPKHALAICLVLLAGFAFLAFNPIGRSSPASREPGSRKLRVPAVGDYHYNAQGWWRVTEVLGEKQIALDPDKRQRLAELRRARNAVLTLLAAESQLDQTYYLVVQKSPPPNEAANQPRRQK